MTSSHPTRAPCQWFARLASALDRRSARRLALLLLGAILAPGRRTVTSCIRAATLSDQFRPCHTAVAAAGLADCRGLGHPLQPPPRARLVAAGRLALGYGGLSKTRSDS
jgi:hypothetical protein